MCFRVPTPGQVTLWTSTHSVGHRGEASCALRPGTATRRCMSPSRDDPGPRHLASWHPPRTNPLYWEDEVRRSAEGRIARLRGQSRPPEGTGAGRGCLTWPAGRVTMAQRRRTGCGDVPGEGVPQGAAWCWTQNPAGAAPAPGWACSADGALSAVLSPGRCSVPSGLQHTGTLPSPCLSAD